MPDNINDNINPLNVFEKLVRLDPESPLSHFSLGRALYQAGNYNAALDAFRASLDCDPDYLLAYLMSGQCHEKLGAAEAARLIYQQGRERARHLGDDRFDQQFAALAITA